MDHGAALQAIRRFVACLDPLAAGRYFIVDGTLLGLVREGGFIAGDYDVDFGIWAEDYREAIVASLVEAGFVHEATFGIPGDGLVQQFRDGAIRIDLACFHRTGQAIWSAVWARDRMLRADFRPFDLAPANFQGIPVMMPSPPERYLEAAYGRAWKTPVTVWDYRYSIRNLRPVGSLWWRIHFRLKKALWHALNRERRPAAGDRE